MPELSKSDLKEGIEKGFFEKGVRQRAAVCYFEIQLKQSNGICDTAVKETALKFEICEKTVYGYIKKYRF